MTIAQSMSHPGRQRELNYQTFEFVARQIRLGLYGVGNDDSPYNRGSLEYEDMKEKLREMGFYFYTGTMPAPYTLGFIEAMMTGIPMVAIGKRLAYDSFYQQNTYEVADIIKSGKNGFVSDDPTTLVKNCQTLLDNPQIARKIGDNGRATAISLFGKDIIKKQWEACL
jgi:glycosyltransferase involved in cell wall biosynthesis